MKIGFHTDAFNSSYKSFERCLQWAQQNHVHVKDVSDSLAAATRGNQTGIAVSQCALGDGVNADNIRRCLRLLHEQGYTGVLSIECEGQGGPMIERSLAWLWGTLREFGIPEELPDGGGRSIAAAG